MRIVRDYSLPFHTKVNGFHVLRASSSVLLPADFVSVKYRPGLYVAIIKCG